MKKLAIVLLAVMLMATAAFASDKPALEKPLELLITADMTEVEPNDTCQDATDMFNIIADGDSYTSTIVTADDVDYYEVFVVADGTYTIQTHPGDMGDTKMYLFADDCTTQLAYNDDGGGQGYYSMFEVDLVAGTTYYVMVIPYGSSNLGTYLLTMDATVVIPPCDAPVNNTCATALPLPFAAEFDVDTCGATNDYSAPASGCTGYTSEGLDVVYVVELVEDQELTVSIESDYDTSLYLVTDCADIENTCVAGSDNYGVPEVIIFDAATAPGTYYLIIDGYSATGLDGIVHVVVGGVVATEDTSWGNVKSMYR